MEYWNNGKLENWEYWGIGILECTNFNATSFIT
jgi:hypothetical protein